GPTYGIWASSAAASQYANTSSSHVGGFLRNSAKPRTSHAAPLFAGTIRMRLALRSRKRDCLPAPRLEHAPEVLRVVGMRELARARQVEVVQPRQPEAKRRGAQHDRPGAALFGGERTHRGIRGEQGLAASLIEHPRAVYAPVVHGDRDVEE